MKTQKIGQKCIACGERRFKLFKDEVCVFCKFGRGGSFEKETKVNNIAAGKSLDVNEYNRHLARNKSSILFYQ